MAARPTATQMKGLVKLGYAMPGGRYYIRPDHPEDLTNAVRAVGRTTTQMGEAEAQAVRRHIMARAKAMNRSDEIPDTWNADGSLKHMDLEYFIKHFGVKGMHWGVRKASSDSSGGKSGSSPRAARKRDKLIAQAEKHENIARTHALVAQDLENQRAELNQHGIHSKAFETAYGTRSKTDSDNQFFFRTGMSRAQALGAADQDLRAMHNGYARSANKHSAKAARLRAEAANIHHSDMGDLAFDAEDYQLELEDRYLQHFGVKGMHWGVRKGSGTPRAGSSEESARAQTLHGKAKVSGLHTLTNDEIQAVNTRLNLEQTYHSLTTRESNVDKGRKFVNTALKDVKTGLDVVETGTRVVKLAKKG